MCLPEFKDFSVKLRSEKDHAHDFTHVERMISICKAIAPPETDVNLVMQAAHFHGLLREETSIRNFLKSIGFVESHIERIIRTVRNSRSLAKPETNEEKVLHDANILDALGAIGVARAFTRGSCENQTLRETVEIMKKNMDRELYIPKAKELAKYRKNFMKNFLKRLEDEL